MSAVFVLVSKLLASLFAFIMFVFLLESSAFIFIFALFLFIFGLLAPLFMSTISILMPRLLVFPFTFALSVTMPILSTYIIKFLYFKSQPKSQPRVFTLSKELFNVASYLLSRLLILYQFLYPSFLNCPN